MSKDISKNTKIDTEKVEALILTKTRKSGDTEVAITVSHPANYLYISQNQ
jgi:hypothetical protein